jgi:hypothetical protein
MGLLRTFRADHGVHNMIGAEIGGVIGGEKGD